MSGVTSVLLRPFEISMTTTSGIGIGYWINTIDVLRCSKGILILLSKLLCNYISLFLAASILFPSNRPTWWPMTWLIKFRKIQTCLLPGSTERYPQPVDQLLRRMTSSASGSSRAAGRSEQLASASWLVYDEKIRRRHRHRHKFASSRATTAPCTKLSPTPTWNGVTVSLGSWRPSEIWNKFSPKMEFVRLTQWVGDDVRCKSKRILILLSKILRNFFLVFFAFVDTFLEQKKKTNMMTFKLTIQALSWTRREYNFSELMEEDWLERWEDSSSSSLSWIIVKWVWTQSRRTTKVSLPYSKFCRRISPTPT